MAEERELIAGLEVTIALAPRLFGDSEGAAFGLDNFEKRSLLAHLGEGLELAVAVARPLDGRCLAFEVLLLLGVETKLTKVSGRPALCYELIGLLPTVLALAERFEGLSEERFELAVRLLLGLHAIVEELRQESNLGRGLGS